MYYVITRGTQMVGVTRDNPYSLNLPDVSIHEMEGIIPDLNLHSWDYTNDGFVDAGDNLTKLEFLNRLTFEERRAIRTSTDELIIDFMKLFDAAGYVSVTHPNTVQGIQYLSMIGIIAPERVAQILS